MSFHYKRGRLSDDAALEARSVRRDLGRLGGSNVNDERTLGDLLAAERDRDDVLANLLRVVAAFKRRLIHLCITLRYTVVNRKYKLKMIDHSACRTALEKPRFL